MVKITYDEFLRRVGATPTVEPDEWDLQMLTEIDTEDDDGGTVTLEDVMAKRDFSGKISIRVPKSLHRDLFIGAKEEGISLNQFILYKLVK
ncbi:MAG: type II toxin-antitoxin system HicB family antitoxin [Oscillospiraceae bacterium]|nr:type II toxin-antitoxin system HicB family antitoxin [Oscillospiraceae bacterium]